MLVTTRSQLSGKAAVLVGFALLLSTGGVNAQTPAPACKKALADATARWPKRNKSADGIMGDAAHKKRKSDHNLGNAFDLTHDPANGVDCNVLSRQVVKDQRVTYVIWNRQIYDRRRAGEGWKKYTGSNPHTKHMHVSIKPESRNDLSAWPWSPGAGKPGSPPSPGTALKRGSKGPEVQKVQQRLQELGYDIGTRKPDGLFGPGTDKAVRKFQGDRKLKVDGIVGPKTRSALFDGKKPNPPAKGAKPPAKGGPIAWGRKVSPEFRAKVVQIAAELKTSPDFLMAAMAFETGGSFSPREPNKAGSGAVGLIQFLPSTAKGLGTSTAALRNMSAVEQLDFVRKYLAPYKGRLAEVDDVYMAILFPRAVGRPADFALFSRGSKAYEQNKGLDVNRDGKVTKAEAAGKVRDKLKEGSSAANKG